MSLTAYDSDTFTQLLDSVTPNLKRRAYSLTRDAHEAEDLYQDTVYQAWRYFNTFELGTSFTRWTMTIMRHQYINRYRKKKRRPYMVSLDEGLTFSNSDGVSEMERPLPDPSPSVEDEVVGSEQWDSFTALLDDIPTKFLEVWLARERDGLSYRQISETLEIPMGTVMSRLARAREQIEELGLELVG